MELSKEVKADEKEKSIIYFSAKRILDLLFALIALIVLSPVFFIISIIIIFDSKGPVFFKHYRLGKNKENIYIYKFRTMYENSKALFENFTDEQKEEFYKNFKLDNDPRITKVGKILRKTSLDELPQLINILKGEMSIIGPRPIVNEEVEKYGEFAEKLFSVTPGLTGLWQANGRSDTTYDERVKMDMYYIDNMSLILDIKILFQTVLSVIKGKGAV